MSAVARTKRPLRFWHGLRRWLPTGVAAVAAVPTTFALAALEGVPGHSPLALQYVSTVQISVREDSDVLRARSQRLVREQFVGTLATFPQLRGVPFELQTSGNDVVFSMITDRDLRDPMQEALTSIIGKLSGRVRAKGKSLIYKAALGPQNGGYLEVALDPTRQKVRSIAAQSVPLRDVLKELRSQVGSLNYLIPGDCAEQLVDWSFGEATAGNQPVVRELNAQTPPPLLPAALGEHEKIEQLGVGAGGLARLQSGKTSDAKDVETIMHDLAQLFGLKAERREGTFIFSGTCTRPEIDGVVARRTAPIVPAGFWEPQPALPGEYVPVGQRAHVFFQLQPFD